MLEGTPGHQNQEKPTDNSGRQKYMDLYHEIVKKQSENPILPFIDEDEKIKSNSKDDLNHNNHEIDLDKDF